MVWFGQRTGLTSQIHGFRPTPTHEMFTNSNIGNEVESAARGAVAFHHVASYRHSAQVSPGPLTGTIARDF